ncbi:1-deoxy-D-xylulose-5-phosphate reductoisomerase [Clostridium sp. Marseille-Q2269]|uniref:1-deoxy-D-xylulose-5-phosphate reductoisomerase n=1 Tax=Clostridium sp. Marseille-Q2269 TaxID=2942205 RepID=UPI00207388AC|nr:1-deoxy-D-xylulose-5-phosphate reductoisomerase [Clostridium sp. Marseille-Q2269]
MKNITILGATGSIGTQTLDVIKKENEELKLIAISANKSYEKVIEIIKEFKPKYAVLMQEDPFKIVENFCIDNKMDTKVLKGMEGMIYISTLEEVNIVVTSVVGMIGLVPTIKAIESGKDIALANKETLVVAGELVISKAKEHNVKILPVDSEHGAIFQCLRGNKKEEVKNIILTASGGPFRGMQKKDLIDIKPENALKHPKWNMGKKISIDSATLMNKGLEVIEAHFLFGVRYENIKVVVHPQSIVHSMVEYKDGSIIAQMAVPDMKLPIQYALNYPNRKKSQIEPLDFYTISNLTFEKPDLDTFSPLKLAYEAGKKAGIMPAILNGANEVAVDLFLKGKIELLQIGDLLEECMNKFYRPMEVTLDNVINVDNEVREYLWKNYDI